MNNSIEASVTRSTLETKIHMQLSRGGSCIPGLTGSSGIGFFDHMLNSFAVHSEMQISLEMEGDLHVDCHHSIEDVGIVLGMALRDIVQKCGKITRYGCSYIPMDEALARCVIDVSGRPYLVCDYTPRVPMIGEYDTQMTLEFFRAVAFNMGTTLHLAVLYGINDHHCVEGLFKAFAHALSDALRPREGEILSAKGVL